MNIKNIEAAIAIMKRAGTVDMNWWQDGNSWTGLMPMDTESKLHACGTAACFAGWIAVSPEFQKDGGSVGHAGRPELGPKECGAIAIAKWLVISHDLAYQMVHSDGLEFNTFYGKNWDDVGAEDVIAKLELIKAGELV